MKPMARYEELRRQRAAEVEAAEARLREARARLDEAYLQPEPSQQMIVGRERAVEKAATEAERTRRKLEAVDRQAPALVQEAAQEELTRLEVEAQEQADKARQARETLLAHWEAVQEAVETWLRSSYDAARIQRDMAQVAQATGTKAPKLDLPPLPAQDPNLKTITESNLHKKHALIARRLEPGTVVARSPWQDVAEEAEVLARTEVVSTLQHRNRQGQGELRKDATGRYYVKSLRHNRWESDPDPARAAAKAGWPMDAVPQESVPIPTAV